MMSLNSTPQTCQEMLEQFYDNPRETTVHEMIFAGVGKRDVYNITSPFVESGREIVIGRVEERNSEFSQVFFFQLDKNIWHPREHTHTYPLQDPCIARIEDEYVFGGVEVIPSLDDPDTIVSWVTQFYRGKSIDSLCHFASGPEKMKDIRLVTLADGRIGVLTRPQGKIGGRGQIGFTVIDRLADLTVEKIEAAYILHDQFIPEEWGGANEAHLLSNGLVGVLGHIACFDQNKHKHYYSIVFALDPETMEKSPMKIIAVRGDFPPGPGKRPDLEDVIFSGGLVRSKNGRALLSVGVSDAEAYQIDIPDPFLEYEQAVLDMAREA
ncbi:DUF1861 family protein [Paenibacillus sp. 1P07SE]|uniref:DUF1861 family protein n=1 Tax=Paenibacillus sp. 1P07SE TaxID=3132209 RepID=UPI0039A6C492